jgi:hypothetical protein
LMARLLATGAARPHCRMDAGKEDLECLVEVRPEPDTVAGAIYHDCRCKLPASGEVVIGVRIVDPRGVQIQLQPNKYYQAAPRRFKERWSLPFGSRRHNRSVALSKGDFHTQSGLEQGPAAQRTYRLRRQEAAQEAALGSLEEEALWECRTGAAAAHDKGAGSRRPAQPSNMSGSSGFGHSQPAAAAAALRREGEGRCGCHLCGGTIRERLVSLLKLSLSELCYVILCTLWSTLGGTSTLAIFGR